MQANNTLHSATRNYRLRSTIDAKEEEGALSSIALFIWGLVMAKAKTGYMAASSNEKLTLKSGMKKLGVFFALISVATLAQYSSQY